MCYIHYYTILKNVCICLYVACIHICISSSSFLFVSCSSLPQILSSQTTKNVFSHFYIFLKYLTRDSSEDHIKISPILPLFFHLIEFQYLNVLTNFCVDSNKSCLHTHIGLIPHYTWVLMLQMDCKMLAGKNQNVWHVLFYIF